MRRFFNRLVVRVLMRLAAALGYKPKPPPSAKRDDERRNKEQQP